MTGGKILGGGEAWLRDAVSHPAGRIEAAVAEQVDRLAGNAEAVLVNTALAAEALQRDEHNGIGYLPVCGLRVFTTKAIGGVSVVTKDGLYAFLTPNLLTAEKWR